MPKGGKIQKTEDGGVLVLDKVGSLVGGFAPPWAVDNAGKKISTHYAVRGDQVVQVVEHLRDNVSYPVVADPFLGRNVINHAFWITKNIRLNGRTVKNFTLYVVKWSNAPGHF